MKSRNLLKLSPFTAGIVGIVFYVIIIFIFISGLVVNSLHTEFLDDKVAINGLLDNSVENIVMAEEINYGLPIHLKIPKINVDAVIEYVGLAPDGAMDVPKNTENAAWFNLGQRPGENGSAIIAGHYGRNSGKSSVFDNLYKLRKGDKLYIEDDKGETISFVVRESRRYNPEADASYVFGLSDGLSHLNLITCEGNWNEKSKSYSTRLVVFTDKE